MQIGQGTTIFFVFCGIERTQIMKRETGFGGQHFFLDRTKHSALPKCFKSLLNPSPSRRYGPCQPYVVAAEHGQQMANVTNALAHPIQTQHDDAVTHEVASRHDITST